jgi:hypothetical protein
MEKQTAIILQGRPRQGMTVLYQDRYPGVRTAWMYQLLPVSSPTRWAALLPGRTRVDLGPATAAREMSRATQSAECAGTYDCMSMCPD